MPEGAERERIMGKNFVKCAAIRAVKTFCQAAIGAIGSTALISEVNWLVVLSTAGMAAIVSVLTSIATGLPEVEMGDPED